ncbi:condensation domain-containing protein [Streptomyces hokutonensis]|uniref:condensation domain-containing protein n=1 Tax=Streptomyces hokutonensis TaxID=1306990 RepID=UPI00382FC933
MANESLAASAAVPFSPDEAVMAQVWEDILEIDGVGPDDDFFSCGGDSLLAITVVAEAQKRGLAITMVHLFKYPTVRGMCGAAVADLPARTATVTDLLSPADRAKVPPRVQEAMPATRLQLGLIYESLMSDGAQYVCTAAHDVRRPLDEAKLREALELVTARHEMLRMRFDLSEFSEAVQIVEHSVTVPLSVADHSALDADALRERTALVTEQLGRPFDPETAPLLRFHAAALDGESFRLTYAYHHALLDGWSAASLLHETVTAYADLLAGAVPEFVRPVPYAEYVRLERAASLSEEAVRHFEALGEQLPSIPPAAGTPRMTGVEARVPQADTDRLFARAAEWRLPVKSMLLAVHGAAIAAERGGQAADVAMLMSGRPELEGSDVTLGLFVNYLPLRLDLAGATWREAGQLAFDAERELLPHRRFPYAEALKIVGHRPFEASFNYVHLRRGIELVEAGLVEPGHFSDVSFDIPLCVDMQNAGDGLTIQITVDTARYGDAFGDRLMERLLDAVHLIAENPDGHVIRA